MTEKINLDDQTRDCLIATYIDKYLECLSTRDMTRILAEQMHEHLDLLSDHELVDEIDVFFPHLIDSHVPSI